MTQSEFNRRANVEIAARVRRFEDVAELDAEQLMTWFETAGMPDENSEERKRYWERVNAEARDDELAAQAFYQERGL